MIYELRWGILSTGGIAGTFSRDLIIDPSTRDVDNVRHRIVAVASRGGQSGVEKSQAFIKDNCASQGQALGSYEELYNHPDVQAIYIGSPHSHHYEHAHAALSAGKAVLCEKAATVNAAQAKALCELARSKRLFFMEAVWTRFFPISKEIQRLLHEERAIGEIKLVKAELCPSFMPETLDPSHRLVNPALAGGALLDLGPYAWVWSSMTHGPLQDTTGKGKTSLDSPLPLPSIATQMTLKQFNKSGPPVDESTAALLRFENGVIVHFDCSLARRTPSDGAVIVHGSQGILTLHWPPFRPNTYRLQVWDGENVKKMADKADRDETKTFEIPGKGHGMFWEADEVARCVRDGRLESATCPWSITVQEMEVFDEMRKQGGLNFPEEIERLNL